MSRNKCDCISDLLIGYPSVTGKMRQLVVVRRICCCSQFMIFLLELLGLAKQPMACPSSSHRKIMDWEQQQILLTTTNCLILPVVWMEHIIFSLWSKHYPLVNEWYIDYNAIFTVWGIYSGLSLDPRVPFYYIENFVYKNFKSRNFIYFFNVEQRPDN